MTYAANPADFVSLPHYGDFVRPRIAPLAESVAPAETTTPLVVPAYDGPARGHVLHGYVPADRNYLRWHGVRAADSVAEHQAARAVDEPDADYQRISDYLSTTRHVVTEAAKSPWSLLPTVFLGRVGMGLWRRRQEHPAEVREFSSAVGRRAGALATRSATWMVDELHDVDWWKLATQATQSPAAAELVTASMAAGPYGRAAKIAYEALRATVAYHNAQANGHARLPAMFGAIASDQLHRHSKGKKGYEQGRAALEQLLRVTAREQVERQHAAPALA